MKYPYKHGNTYRVFIGYKNRNGKLSNEFL